MDGQLDSSPKMSFDGELTSDEARRWAELTGVPFMEEISPARIKPLRLAERSGQGVHFWGLTIWLLVIGFIVLCGLAVISGASSLEDTEEKATATVPLEPIDRLTRNDTWQPVFESVDGVDMVFVPARCISAGFCFMNMFWIDRYEISNQQAGIVGDDIFSQRPYVNVSQIEAQAYCEQRGGRLPTAQEWTYAAGGVEQWKYPWGNRFDGSNANFCDRQCSLENRDDRYNDGYEQVAKTTRFEAGASWVGALNMSGNVAEWTQLSDTAAEMVEVRGGSWAADKESISTYRIELVDIDYRDDRIGFRCVIDTIESD